MPVFLMNLKRIPDLEPISAEACGKSVWPIRMAITSKGHGKRGGARVITFTVIVSVEEAVINLLTIYDKSERESISRSEILALLEKNGLR